MTLSPPIDARPDTRHSCWLSAGSDQAHIAPLDPQPVASPIWLPSVRCARSALHAHPCFEASRSSRPFRSNLLKPDPAAKSP